MIDLAGKWTLADAEGEHSLPAAVPGDVHSVLHAAGHIPDPYAGRNEYGARWSRTATGPSRAPSPCRAERALGRWSPT